MRWEIRRLMSFRQWPGPGTVSPQQLSRAGFFYLGPRDRVQCFCCGGILRSWEPGDRPGAEHRKYFPSCPFMQGRDVGNVPLGGATDSVDGQILGQLQRLSGDEDEDWQAVYPDLLEERQRLRTFHNWPQYSGVSPEQLARAGFFYTGQRDNVRCFHCDGELRNWEQGDDPWREHAKWFPRCEFLVHSMGAAYIGSVQEAIVGGPRSLPASQRTSERSPNTSADSPGHWQDYLQSSIVQGALQMGFDESLVASVVQSRFLLVGTPYNCLSELVTELLDDVAHAEEERVPQTPEPARIPEGPAQSSSSQAPKPETPLSAEEQLRRLKEERTCKVCMDKDVSMVFVPCGHLVVCVDCAPNLRHCPICRATIRGSMRAFMS
ncbi:PREDICTED: baculoviral IAP repeat-containing protein 7 [Nanorana parkeri]|uniref:baculoviral IAP repeat-containing protein 7 n=1 Tax=Nanorana parkeri TaxID=125878 RepID=UPI000854D9EF|nr:PREDICTED: baculoviral IAP repeat-containing protein 7 [Nanorana parkeri]